MKKTANRSRVLKGGICFLAAVVFSLTGYSNADLIVHGSHADYPVIPGGSLDDVRLQVELSVNGGLATMTFTNVSVAPEQSAVFKLIVIDTLDDDTGEAVLWDGSVLSNCPKVRDRLHRPQFMGPLHEPKTQQLGGRKKSHNRWGSNVLTDTSDVSYSLEPYNVLPGYNPDILDGESMVQLQANPPAPKKGIAPGEMLQVQFNTSLPGGSDIDDYLAFFNGGDDTAPFAIGFQAINADVVEGESVSGVNLPEPSLLALLSTGGLILLARRQRTRTIA